MGVRILSETTKNPLQKIGEYAGICWNSKTDDPEKNIKRAKDCILSGHGRVLEYVDIELEISGYSARCIREWYTHIAGGPTRLQESTRYCLNENFDYVIPPSIESHSGEYHFIKAIEAIQYSITELNKLNVPKEDIAMLLPLCMTTKIVDKRNLRNMINLMNQRLCTRAFWEIRQLANEIKQKLSDYSSEWKWIADNLFVPKCESAGFCTEKNSCGRKPKAGFENVKAD